MSPSKPTVVRISRHHHSFDHQKNRSFVKNKQSNNVIHVFVGSPKISSISHKQTSKAISIISEKDKTLYLNSQIKKENTLLDHQGLTTDHHRTLKHKKKKKWSRQCCIVCLIITFLIIIMIISTILLILLIKPKQTTIAINTPQLRWNTTGITIAGITSSAGNSSTQLNIPFDAIVDHACNLFIADQINNRIQKYSFGSSVGVTIAGNMTPGSSQSQLYNPSRIILDTNEDFYIADTSNNRIVFWHQGATSGTTVAGGSYGNANNQLKSPYGMALHPTLGTLFVADQMNNRIMSYAQNASSGSVVLGNQGPGINTTQLNTPVGLCLDPFSNSLLIANSAGNNVVRYVLGSGNAWKLFAGNMNGSSGSTPNSFDYPTGVTIDPIGNVYVCDRTNYRIQFFDNTQSIGQTIAGITGISGNSNTTLNEPSSITLDSQLNLYVADRGNHRIQKFLRY